MSDLQTFHELVNRMMSVENTDRQAAETQYDEIEPAQKSSLLYQLYAEQSVAEGVRSMALVLLRRLISNTYEELVAAWGAENQKGFQQQILQAVTSENSHSLRKKLADIIAELARNSIDDDTSVQKWPEVLQFIEHCSSAESSELKEMAMILIESVPNIFGADQEKYLPGIKSILESCLANPASGVRSSAVKAFVAFISFNDEDDKIVKNFSSLISPVIKVCEHVVATEEDDDGPLQALVDLASTVPKAITPHFTTIFEMCIATIANKERDDIYRHSSMEIMTTICEASANTVKKRIPNLIPGMLQSALLMMTELEDDITDWLEVDDTEEEDDNEENVAIGESSLDRISCALHGKAVLPTFLEIANTLLGDADWKKRHAGLMGLSTVGEGCARAMEPIIDGVVAKIVPFLGDTHPRVRYAACNALGQMSTDFNPTLQKKCHAIVVPGLMTTLVDVSCARVAAHSAAALVNFCEDCPQQVIGGYLTTLMEKLEWVLENMFKQLLEKGRKLVLEQVITTIASVADAAQDQFVTFYDRLIGPLKYILKNAEGDDYKVMRGKTIECISLIGLAVGKEKFGPDAAEIMQVLSTAMPTLNVEDPQCSYMISSWARICKVLGPDFAPFLPMVMPSMLSTAEYNPDVAVLDEEDVHEDPSWTFSDIGEKKQFGIKTSGLDEKATSFEMIVCYARELGEAFAPYVDEVAKLCVGNIRFFFHEDVRTSSAECMPYLLACVKAQGGDAMRRLWEGFFPALKEAIEEEDESEVLAEMLNAVGDCMAVVGQNLKPEEVQEVAALITKQLEEYERRTQEREAEEEDEDADPEDGDEKLDDEMELETNVLARISDLVHASFSTVGGDFFHLVEGVLPKIVALTQMTRSYAERQWGLCMLDDFCEYATQAMAKYVNEFVPNMLKSLADWEFPEVRQAAAYGFGVMALKGGAIPEFTQVCAAALEPLAAIVARPDARSTEEGSVATENAIAAVAKILKHCGSGIDASQVIPLFLSWLPIHEDKEESVFVYDYFADLVESNNPLVLGADNSNLPRLLQIIVGAIQHEAFEEDAEGQRVAGRMVAIVKGIQQLPIFQAVVQASNFDAEGQQTLQRILSA